jgi:hypothetical protein
LARATLVREQGGGKSEHDEKEEALASAVPHKRQQGGEARVNNASAEEVPVGSPRLVSSSAHTSRLEAFGRGNTATSVPSMATPHDVLWQKGPMLGKGAFGTVRLTP